MIDKEEFTVLFTVLRYPRPFKEAEADAYFAKFDMDEASASPPLQTLTLTLIPTLTLTLTLTLTRTLNRTPSGGRRARPGRIPPLHHSRAQPQDPGQAL